MHAVVLTGALVGAGSLVGAHALVAEGQEVPAGWLWLGVPGKPVRPLRPDEVAGLAQSAAHYVERAARYRERPPG
jgi:carbonic anhydrase/acetyltransferase-like protein (isoleucine patch superfamily)